MLIFSASAVSFVLARLALRHEVRWLYITDTLLALLIAVAGAISLTNWGLSPIMALAFVFAECVIFAAVMLSQGEKGLFRGGMVFLYLAYMCASLAGLIEVGEYYFPDDFEVKYIEPSAAMRVAVMYWLMCAAGAGLYALRTPQQDEKAELSVRRWLRLLLLTMPFCCPWPGLRFPLMSWQYGSTPFCTPCCCWCMCGAGHGFWESQLLSRCMLTHCAH